MILEQPLKTLSPLLHKEARGIDRLYERLGGDQIFDGDVEHLSNTDQGLDGWVLVGPRFKLDDGVVVHLGLASEFVAGEVLSGAELLELSGKLVQRVFLFHKRKKR